MADKNDGNNGTPENDTTSEKPKKSIEQILRERKELEKELQTEYTRDVTLMFTDIKGSTSFFERRGDIEGRSMIQEHNDILFPLIKEREGIVIKTIGDAVMASFPGPEDAVRSAMKIQRTLLERNKGKTEDEQINIRIGLNYGKGIVQDDDVFGDVVNVAARVESLADSEQILISKPLYDEVRRTEDILCRYFDSTEVKGKSEPLDIYRVVWGDEDMVLDKTRSAGGAAPARLRLVRKIFELEISREKDKVKVSGHERTEGKERTVVHYEDAQISPAEIEKHCQEVTKLLNSANKQGKVSKDILVKLQKAGQQLFNGLLTAKAKQQILSTEAEDLVINIDDQLVQIPWELVYDGKQFLCQRFNMGRLVKTRQAVDGVKTRRVERPLKMLILSDPRKDLQSSHKEGTALFAAVEGKEGFITANHKDGNVSITDVGDSLCHYDVIHYAGHADYDIKDASKSGWLLSDGKFTPKDIKKAASAMPLPALVFSNACHSGQTGEWKIDENFEDKIYGLANGFLLHGVQHYIGTFWEVQDEPSALFALEFYREFIEGGNTVGESVRLAREALIKKYGEETIVWGSYMLYGDPADRYFDLSEPAAEKKELHVVEKEAAPAPPPSPRISTGALVGLFAGVLILVGLLVGTYIYFNPPGGPMPKDPLGQAYAKLNAGKIGDAEKRFELISQSSGAEGIRGYEGLAAVFFQRGDYQGAQDLCEKVISSDPENVYAHVIMGNIFFNQGSVDVATKSYETAAEAKQGFSWQRAEAYNRLGRIYAEQNKSDAALSSYDEAIALNPDDFNALSNKGVLLAGLGQKDEAIASYRKAVSKNPQDGLTVLLLNQLLGEKKGAADKERNDRIDNLVAGLLERFKEREAGEQPAYLSDTWTSRPLSITFLEFASKGGLASRAGENDFLVLKLVQSLQGTDRISVVERELIDKLLEELNLSSSDLTDPATALKLGKIIGARFITTGSITRLGKEMQVALRVIETETSSITCAFTEVGEQGANLGSMAETLAKQVSEKLLEMFPLKGKVASADEETVILNIGSSVGVKVGLQLHVFQDGEAIVMDGREIGRGKTPIGQIEIVAVEEGMSTGKFIEQEGEFNSGQKAIEIPPAEEEPPAA